MPKVLVIDDGKAARWERWKRALAWDAAYAEKVSEFMRKYPDMIVGHVHDEFQVDALKLASNAQARKDMARLLDYLLIDAKEKLCYDVKTIPLEIK